MRSEYHLWICNEPPSVRIDRTAAAFSQKHDNQPLKLKALSIEGTVEGAIQEVAVVHCGGLCVMVSNTSGYHFCGKIEGDTKTEGWIGGRAM